jgi:hypothetical protein
LNTFTGSNANVAHTSNAETQRMKMPNGGFYPPPVYVQLATDTESRAIVRVEVSNKGGVERADAGTRPKMTTGGAGAFTDCGEAFADLAVQPGRG